MRSTCCTIILFIVCLSSSSNSSNSSNLLSNLSFNYTVDVPRVTGNHNHFAFHGGDLAIMMLQAHHGYIQLPNNKNAKMFYYFFPAPQDTTHITKPVVLWLSGGPGVTTNIALFYENGPLKFEQDGIIRNINGWDQISNIIFVDQPIGTGFSKEDTVENIRHNEDDIANDLYDFLQGFFAINEAFSRQEFYITGQDYASHYATTLALKILERKDGPYQIRLRGVAIGNPLINLATQYATIPKFAKSNNRISDVQLAFFDDLIEICKLSTKICAKDGASAKLCRIAFHNCDDILKQVIHDTGDRNCLDIRTLRHSLGTNYDYSKLVEFLSHPDVLNAVRVTMPFEDFELQGYNVEKALRGDWAKNINDKISTLLGSGIKFLSYAGQWDLVYNYDGVKEALLEIEWYGKGGFQGSKDIKFFVDNIEAGEIRTSGQLTYIKIFNAGRMVPMDTPRIASEIIRTWMSNGF